MLNILICEDNKEQRLRIEGYIKESIEKNKYDYHIVKSTNNPFEVIEYAKMNTDDTNVYFFDIDLKEEINGIQAAALIRKEDVKAYFIFITAHKEYSMMTFEYKLKALDYINKGDYLNLKNKIDECIKTVYSEYQKISTESKESEEILKIKSGTRTFNVFLKDILYFETISNHKVKMHSVSSDIEYYSNLTEVMKNLDQKNFCRVHKAFIVNRKHVEEFNHKDMYALMNNGDRCQLSRKYAKELVNK